jgi:hypothetical protein
MIELSWPEFKTIISGGVNFYCLQYPKEYKLYAASGDLNFECSILKEYLAQASWIEDFEANYKSLASSKITKQQSALPEPDGYRFRGRRTFYGTVTDTPHVFSYTIPEALYITGFVFQALNHSFLDYISFGVYAPNDTLIELFVPEWNVSDEPQLIEVYKAYIPANFKIKCTYTKVNDATDPIFWANAFLHKKA